MKEALKFINECVFSKLDKVERLNKLDNLRKFLCSNFDTCSYTKLFELIDYISLMIIDKKTDFDNDLISVRENMDKEKELIDIFNEFRNSILNILVEASNTVFYAQ